MYSGLSMSDIENLRGLYIPYPQTFLSILECIHNKKEQRDTLLDIVVFQLKCVPLFN